ncbi:serine-type endopeptidase [Aureococcus anophagefferens]|nr:serine-type endopeptidase [Aureococcus anophagefferens]
MTTRLATMLLVLQPLARAATTTPCDCPYQLDGICHASTTADGLTGPCACDPYDCGDPCGAALTCEQCRDVPGRDCVFCAKEGLCADADAAPTRTAMTSWFGAPFSKIVANFACELDDYADACAPSAYSDPYGDAQAWYLDAMRVPDAWAAGVTGAGVVVDVVDDGVDAAHPDLAKLDASRSRRRRLSSCRLRDDRASIPDAIYDGARAVDVSSNSWGYDECATMLPTYGRRLEACPFAAGRPWSERSAADVCATCAGEDWNGAFGAACHTAIAEHCEYHFADDEDACRAFDHLYTSCAGYQIGDLPEFDALEAGAREGRGGRGVIYVWATGNGYREGGAATFVVAPGGDDDHVHGMVGAVAAGACGSIPPGTSRGAARRRASRRFVLEANQRLGWRDVQGVLASTSRRVDLGSDDSWTTNLAGVSHSYKYGFGLVDARGAGGRRWANWPEERKLEATNVAAETIFDYDGTERWVESEIAFSEKNVAVESVNVFVTIDHPHRGELWIELERGGVTSILTDDTYNFGNRYEDWKFLTLRHWGEPLDAGPSRSRRGQAPRHDGRLELPEWAFVPRWHALLGSDDDGDDDGELVSWRIEVFGRDVDPDASPSTARPTATADAAPTGAPTVAPDCGAPCAEARFQEDYRGAISETATGLRCQKWTSQAPNAHGRTPANYPDAGLGDHNSCRNPDGDSGRAWCYNAEGTDPRWQYCDVPYCSPLCDAASLCARHDAEQRCPPARCEWKKKACQPKADCASLNKRRCKKRKSSCRWRREACRSRNECASLKRKSCKANGTSCKWKRKAKKCKAR